MSLQYISDNKGQTTGVFIPIQEWNKMKEKYKDLESNELTIPEWQLAEIDKRLDEYTKSPKQALDFDQAMDEIEKDL
jgi:hypothetical protein